MSNPSTAPDSPQHLQGPASTACDELAAALDADSWQFVPAARMRPLLDAQTPLSDWAAFADSWNHLQPDPYLAALGRDRRRRHAVFHVTARGDIEPAGHQPHFQSRHYNHLQGDIERWFEPIRPDIATGATMQAILGLGRLVFGLLLAPRVHRRIEVHQFRIEVLAGRAGHPTPEGSHRDGVDHVLVLMVDRHNIRSGATTIQTPDGRMMGEFTLTQPLDTALVIDARVHHGVTPVQAIDATQPAHRDVLVVTYLADPAGQ